MSARTLERIPLDRPEPPSSARSVPRVRFGRWGLRGVAFLYLGLMVALPLGAIVSRGFGGGVASLREAFSQPGARQALVLTIEMAALVAVINAVFGTVIAYVLTRYRFVGRGRLDSRRTIAMRGISSNPAAP